MDEFFHVPHFEIMLYDNPQLALTYLAAFQITQDAQYAGGRAAPAVPAVPAALCCLGACTSPL